MTALNEKQWDMLEPLLPIQNFKKGGRPRADDRTTLNGILWVLKTGAQWSEMPKEYGSYVTCWRRLKKWEEDETWVRIWKRLLAILDKKDRINWAISFLDGSFVPAKRGAQSWAHEEGKRNQMDDCSRQGRNTTIQYFG